MLRKLWADDAGIVALEYMLVATFVGLTLIVGLNALGIAITGELLELANAIAIVDQSYSVSDIGTCVATKSNQSALDLTDTFDVTVLTSPTVTVDITLCP
jgi:Flp pilus assembly pilin Flp